ncbi:peptidyl-prolyl cis-trans isomerase [Pelagibacterales bacterium SAG-MED31]|nr:peptidyl-prolyl cis-trans isomerase [Pelagibacterales bacterium SAG-MED31]
MFRSLGKSKIALVLAILFGISLFFFRGSSRYSGIFDSDNIVASVSGTPISTTKFLRVLDLNLSQYSQMFGRELTSEEIQGFQIHSMALGSLINNAVFENEFDSKGFIIDETVIASETKKRFPNIYNKNNKINEDALNSFLKQQRLKIDDLVKIINYETRSKVFDELFFNVNLPSKFENIINKHSNHSRNLDLIKFKINEYELSNIENYKISLNNSEIIDFFNQNIDAYMNQEKRDISYILIDKSNYSDQFTPSIDQIAKYYNNNKNLFLDPEKRNFIQFNFKSFDEATKFRNNTLSLSYDNIIEYAEKNKIIFNKFTEVAEDEVLEELSEVIFKLNENNISPVVETALAKHVVIVNKIYPEQQNTIKESQNKISNTLLEVELNNFILDLKNIINQQILDGLSLNEIANNNSLLIKKINNAERNIDTKIDDLIKNTIVNKAFSINKDFVSDIEEINENQSIIINVDNIIFAKPYELNKVFKKVSEDWIKSIKVKEIESYIDKSIADSKSLKDLSIYFKTEMSNIDLQLASNDYSSNFKNSVFESKLNKIYFSVSNDEVFIAKTNEVTFPSNQENIKGINLSSELRGIFGAEIVKNKNISTNDNLIQALISQY